MPSGRPLGLCGKRYDYMEIDEVRKFFSAILPERTDHILMFRLQSNCGLRISEVVGVFKKRKLKDGTPRTTNIPPLRCSDIVMDRKILKIQGKRNKRRDVTFESESTVEEALKRHFELENPPDILLLNRSGRRLGKPYTPRQAWEIMKKYCIKAGIQRPWSGPGAMSPHLLRHTYATQLLMAGANITWVQMQLGHDSIATTQIYSNLAAVGKARATAEGIPKVPY